MTILNEKTIAKQKSLTVEKANLKFIDDKIFGSIESVAGGSKGMRMQKAIR